VPTVVSSGSTRGGPNIQAPIGSTSAFGNRLGFLGGRGGYWLSSQRAAKKPGSPDLPVPSDLQGLTQTQGGNFNDPFAMWSQLTGMRAGGGGLPPVTRERLGQLATANQAYGGFQRANGLGAAAPGFGELGSIDPLRKLIQQRMGGAL
jgi:hypothetical protein